MLKRLFLFKGSQQSAQAASTMSQEWQLAKSMYEFECKDIDGNPLKLDKYSNRVCLIVNVACKWGFTGSNYTQLQDLHAKYSSNGLSILAFPCNQFGGQEPGNENEIKDFVKKFNVQFDMFSKVNVNGDQAEPLFKYLKAKLDGTFGSSIKWNFSKFLINKQGIPVKRYAPTVAPKDIEADIQQLLKE